MQYLSLFFFMIFLTPFWAMAGDTSPKLSGRGLQAYHAGKYDLAKLFFNQALQDAVLKGHEEWVVKSALNLVDLELDAQNTAEAAKILKTLQPSENKALQGFILWKKSQCSFLDHQFAMALMEIEKAMPLLPNHSPELMALQFDQYKYLLSAKKFIAHKEEYQKFKASLSKKDQWRALPLEAKILMSENNFGDAAKIWNECTASYREKGQLQKTAASLNQLAICQFRNGQKELAKEANSKAIGIYGELGLLIPGLKAQALKMSLTEDKTELAKLQQDMDLVGQRVSQFDLQEVLHEYAQVLAITQPTLMQ